MSFSRFKGSSSRCFRFRGAFSDLRGFSVVNLFDVVGVVVGCLSLLLALFCVIVSEDVVVVDCCSLPSLSVEDVVVFVTSDCVCWLSVFVIVFHVTIVFDNFVVDFVGGALFVATSVVVVVVVFVVVFVTVCCCCCCCCCCCSCCRSRSSCWGCCCCCC